MISWQVPNQVKTDFPSSTHGMLPLPPIHSFNNRIKSNKNKSSMSVRNQDRLQKSRDQPTKTSSHHLNLWTTTNNLDTDKKSSSFYFGRVWNNRGLEFFYLFRAEDQRAAPPLSASQREERPWNKPKCAAAMPSLLSRVVRIILHQQPPATTTTTDQDLSSDSTPQISTWTRPRADELDPDRHHQRLAIEDP
jgi:hypothetical protein